MADTEQVIFEINVDVGQSEQKVQDLSKDINQLTGEQKMLRTEIKKNGDETGIYSKRLEENRIETSELKKERKSMIEVLNANSKSIDKVRAANKKLTKERNSLNLATKEGKEELIALNKKIDENNKFIKENLDGLGKQKQSIGGYSDGIKEALPGLSGFTEGIKQSTKASLAFMATGLGIALTAIVVIFKALQAAFKRSISSQEKMNAITGKLSAAFGVFLDALTPVVDFILDAVIGAFDLLGEAFDYAIEQLEKFGLISEDTADNFDKASAAAERLATSERNLIESDIALQKLQLNYQTQAEKLRQIRDDDILSIEKRISANAKLGALLKSQSEAEMAQAEKVLQIEKDRVIVHGETNASIRAIGDAEIKLLEITERITSQESEQRTNINSLLREKEALLAIEAENQLARDEENLAVMATKLEFENSLKQDSLNRLVEMNSSAQKQIADRAIKEANRAAKAQQDLDKATVKVKQALFSAGQKVITNAVNSAIDDEIKGIQNQSQIQQDLLKVRLEAGEISEAEYAKEIDKIKKKQRYDEAKAEKKKALFDIAIATAVAVVKALPNPVTAALAAALGAIELAVVAAKPLPTLAKGGGIFTGNLHSQGGVQLAADGVPIAEVERDEGFFVMKRSATSELSGLSALNEKHGGASFFDTPQRFLADGGEVQQQTDTASIVNAIQDLNIFVTVTDIKEGLATQAQITELSTI